MNKYSGNLMENLPKGWTTARLGRLGHLFSGGTPPKDNFEYWGGSIPFLTGADITQFAVTQMNARAFLTENGLKSGRTFRCTPDTVLIVSRTRVGRIGLAKEIMGVSQDICPFVCSEYLDPEYLCSYLQSISTELVRNSRGATIQGLRKEYLLNLEIPFPSLFEQKRITEILKEKNMVVENAKRAAEKQLEDIRALRAAYLREVFPPTGDRLPEGWKWLRLKEICIPDKRIVVSNSEESKQLSFIGLENIESNSGRIMNNGDNSLSKNVKSSAFYFDTRHVLYGKLRPYLNKVALPAFSGRCSTELIPLIPKDISREYLVLILRQQSIVDAVMKEKTGTRMPRASIEALLNQLVPLPPKEAQEEILRRVNNKIEVSYHIEYKGKEQLELLGVLSQAYLRQAFRGELA